MIGYEPGWRPMVRAELAQAPAVPTVAPAVAVPPEIANSTAQALVTASRNRNLALLASGLAAVAGGVVAYGAYPKKNPLQTSKFMAPLLFGIFNTVIFGYVLVEG